MVVSLTNIGDVILTLPVLSVLRAEFENARIDLICGRAPLALFQGSVELGKLFAYDKKWGLLQKWFWVREIAKEKYDLVVDLRHTLIPLLVGARYRTKLIRRKNSGIISVRDKHLSLLRDLGLDLTHQKPISLFGPKESEKVKQKLAIRGLGDAGPYAVIAPGTNSSTKQWTLEGFEGVVRFLSGEKHLNIVLAGGTQEKEISKSIEKWGGLSGIKIYDMTGETTLRELAALIAGAQLLVANDSAAMQLAQEMEVRVVGIFGPTNPWKYSRENGKVKVVRLDLECSPCEAAQCQIERRKCLDDLSPELVKQAVNEVLNS